MAIPAGRYTYHQELGFRSFNEMFRKLVMMMRMDEIERGLVLSILANQNNPELRHIYADWLLEYNRNEEAQAERSAAEILSKPPKERYPFSGSIVSGMIGFSTIGFDAIGGSDYPPPNDPPIVGGWIVSGGYYSNPDQSHKE